jgi:hypothetical protein
MTKIITAVAVAVAVKAALRNEHGVHTKRPPLLLLCLCSLAHLDRVVDDEVHKLIETLDNAH